MAPRIEVDSSIQTWGNFSLHGEKLKLSLGKKEIIVQIEFTLGFFDVVLNVTWNKSYYLAKTHFRFNWDRDIVKKVVWLVSINVKQKLQCLQTLEFEPFMAQQL